MAILRMVAGQILVMVLAAQCFLCEAGAEIAMVVMEKGAASLPDAWRAVGPTPKGKIMELTFAVKQQNLQQLRDTLMRVSRPASPDYGKHLSNAEVHMMTAPDPAHVQAVSSFLRRHGVEPRNATPSGDLIEAVVTVETAQKMLSAEYLDIVHKSSGSLVSRALAGYRLPSEVASAVDFVAPTVHLPGVRRPRPPVKKGSEYSNYLEQKFNTPKNLRKLYRVDETEGKAANNKQAVTAFLGERYSEAPLKKFWGLLCENITCGKGTPKLVGDATNGTSPGLEAMLDIEFLTGVAGNIESEFWGFGGRSPDNIENEPFLKWLSRLSNTSDAEVPKIFSTSYGEDENSWSYAAADRLNVEFQKAGVRGISILYASGDAGSNCQKDGQFAPEGPGSSPYVTAVGGTKPGHHWPKPGSEVAVGLSSGGFSNYWPMPDYQKDAVAHYLEQAGLPPPSRGYNTSGRAVPDISAQAAYYYVIGSETWPGVAGTSCSTPVVSAIFSLLNDLRLQKNKSTLGFLNPLIYEYAAAFNDITAGSSVGCQDSLQDRTLHGWPAKNGWPAKQGWDAVTGVGTPDFVELAEVVDSLPAGHAVPVDQAADDVIVWM
mmetsp:Transcript_3469/g.5577  ORF Transcript_3469/g.5577 Transcript_3469/m.5577 type:complete len:601 (-) Transcript_3469:15-1817(-)